MRGRIAAALSLSLSHFVGEGTVEKRQLQSDCVTNP